jgi:ATP-binding cassette, subfamily C, bacterial
MAGQQQLHHCLHALPCLRDAQTLLTTCRAAQEPPLPAASPSPAPIALEREIRLDQVRVRYADRDQPALDGISLSLPVRTTTAIMGASGAGKSTLADVLMGLLVPDGGRVLLDGQPLSADQRMRWRGAVAYVPQDTFLFHDSIRRNLLWGLPAADDTALSAALRRAAADFVFDLPQGLDTVVGDQGVRLSGGERQRIALARALLRRPSLLILDEATSALDLENETRVRQAVEHLHGDLTVVIIGHRLPTLEHADQIVVLAQGRIVCQGSWQEVAPWVAPGVPVPEAVPSAAATRQASA